MTTPTPEELKAMTAAKAAAAEKTAAGASEISGGLVKSTEKPDAVQAGAQAMEKYQWKTPKADFNFWSQAPAVMEDAGHVLGEVKRGAIYDLNNYTPYPYIVKGAQSVVNYFTPTADHSGLDKARQVLADSATRHPENVNQDTYNALATADRQIARNTGAEMPEGTPKDGVITGSKIPEVKAQLPANVKLEADGSYTKSIYDRNGNYIGYGNSKTPYANEPQAEELLKQNLGPQAQAIYERNKAIMDARLSDTAPVAVAGPGGQLIQSNYDASGNIVRNNDPRVRALVDNLLQERAATAQAAMPARESANADQSKNFFAEVKARRDMEAAQGMGPGPDPVRNQQAVDALVNSATALAAARGGKPADYLPEQDLRNPNPLVTQAQEQLRNPGMSQAEKLAGNLAVQPNSYGQPQAIDESRAQKIATVASGIDNKADTAKQQADRLEFYQKMNEAKIPAPVQMAVKEYDRELDGAEKALNELVKSNPTAVKPGKPAYDRLAKQIADLHRSRSEYLQKVGLQDKLAQFPEPEAPGPVAPALPPKDKLVIGQQYIINGTPRTWNGQSFDPLTKS